MRQPLRIYFVRTVMQCKLASTVCSMFTLHAADRYLWRGQNRSMILFSFPSSAIYVRLNETTPGLQRLTQSRLPGEMGSRSKS